MKLVNLREKEREEKEEKEEKEEVATHSSTLFMEMDGN